MSTEFLFCYIPCPTENLAKSIAVQLVTEKLAACTNIFLGAKSIYVWDSTLHEDTEVILIAKTTKKLFPNLEKKVIEMHDYECPCIIALNISEMNEAYAGWFLRQVQAF